MPKLRWPKLRWSTAIATGLVTNFALLATSFCPGPSLGANPPLGQPASPVVSPSTAAARPSEKLADLAYFQGTWRCRVREVSAPVSQSFAEFNWTVKRELNNYWYLGSVVSPDKTGLAHDTLGYNTLNNKFGRTILTADGGFYNFLSDGWQGNTFTWEGSALDMGARTKQSIREVIERKSPRQFEATYYTLNPTSQTWNADVKEICEK